MLSLNQYNDNIFLITRSNKKGFIFEAKELESVTLMILAAKKNVVLSYKNDFSSSQVKNLEKHLKTKCFEFIPHRFKNRLKELESFQ